MAIRIGICICPGIFICICIEGYPPRLPYGVTPPRPPLWVADPRRRREWPCPDRRSEVSWLVALQWDCEI